MDINNLSSILYKMLLIRNFEEKVAEIAAAKEIFTPVHLYVGQEAIAAAIAENLTPEDYVYSTHRSHGHYLAKGGDPQKLMSEIFCREDGCSEGKGGSMHVIDRTVNFMGSSPIVGGTIPITVGSGLAAKYYGKGHVSVGFFGDGATDEGVFYESVNFATLYKLPVLFVCENNAFSTHLPDFMRQSNPVVSERIKGFNIKTAKVDGNDPVEIFKVSGELINSIRRQEGPALIECSTYRWLSHVGYWKDLDVGFRKKKDVEHWMKKCPIKKLSGHLVSNGHMKQTEIDAMEAQLRRQIEKYVEISRRSNSPSASMLFKGLHS